MSDPTNTTPVQPNDPERNPEGRTVWIVTGYAASLLALLGVLAYHFSVYLYR